MVLPTEQEMRYAETQRQVQQGNLGTGNVTPAMIREYYRVYLKRDPSNGEVNELYGVLKNYNSDKLKEAITNSDEYKLYAKDKPDFNINTAVRDLYREVMKRDPSFDEIQTMVKSGKSIEDIRNDMLQSPEYALYAKDKPVWGTQPATPTGGTGQPALPVLDDKLVASWQPIAEKMLQGAFTGQTSEMANRYAQMGRSNQGDAYNKALAKLGLDYQSKSLSNALDLATNQVQSAQQGSQIGLDWEKFKKAPEWEQENRDWQLKMANTIGQSYKPDSWQTALAGAGAGSTLGPVGAGAGALLGYLYGQGFFGGK